MRKLLKNGQVIEPTRAGQVRRNRAPLCGAGRPKQPVSIACSAKACKRTMKGLRQQHRDIHPWLNLSCPFSCLAVKRGCGNDGCFRRFARHGSVACWLLLAISGSPVLAPVPRLASQSFFCPPSGAGARGSAGRSAAPVHVADLPLAGDVSRPASCRASFPIPYGARRRHDRLSGRAWPCAASSRSRAWSRWWGPRGPCRSSTVSSAGHG